MIDTSGSMDAKEIGKALGSIASYSIAHDVPFARVVFCDAAAYDIGYVSPEDIAGRVCIKGRGGTVLQPGINALESAKDFPADGPILIITDGGIEDHLDIKHEHAYLLPKGAKLPFKAKGVSKAKRKNARHKIAILNHFEYKRLLFLTPSSKGLHLLLIVSKPALQTLFQSKDITLQYHSCLIYPFYYTQHV